MTKWLSKYLFVAYSIYLSIYLLHYWSIYYSMFCNVLWGEERKSLQQQYNKNNTNKQQQQKKQQHRGSAQGSLLNIVNLLQNQFTGNRLKLSILFSSLTLRKYLPQGRNINLKISAQKTFPENHYMWLHLKANEPISE